MKFLSIAPITTVILVTTVMLVTLTGCSTDVEEMEESTIIVDPELIPDPEPEPDWADSAMTITVGRFETRQQMLDKLMGSSHVSRWAEEKIEKYITDEKVSFTPPDKQYTVDIVVLTMKEVGIHDMGLPDNPANITRITKHFRERGYRPLTTEEAIELRLHLPDQPDSSTRHKMSSFLVLSGEEFALLDHFGRKGTFVIGNISFEEGGTRILEKEMGIKVVKAFRHLLHENRRTESVINPNDTTSPLDLIILAGKAIRVGLLRDKRFKVDLGGPEEGYPTARFAAAVINSEKRQ